MNKNIGVKVKLTISIKIVSHFLIYNSLNKMVVLNIHEMSIKISQHVSSFVC